MQKVNSNINDSFSKEKDNSDFVFKIYFFFLGLINNSTYVVILSASKTLVKQFEKENYLSLFSGCLIIFSFLIRILNLIYFVKIKHKKRIRIACFGSVIGISIIVLSIYVQSFLLCLLGTIMIGSSCSFGDTTLQGYLKCFKPEIVSGFSMGTGFAGVYGSIYWLLMEYLQFTIVKNLSFMILVYFIYYLVFHNLVKKKVRIQQIEIYQDQTQIIKDNENQIEKQIEITQNYENNEVQVNEILNFSNVYNVLKNLKYYSINLGLVYFFEYSIITFIANVISNNFQKQNYFQKNSFFIFQILYQFGVFLGRSSLSIKKIPQLKLLTFVQMFMYVFTMYLAYAKIQNLLLNFGGMFMTGIIGGLAFINCLYGIFSDDRIILQKKELSTTINSMFCDAGILMNSLTGLLFMKYLFNN